MTEFLPLCDVLFNVISLAGYFCDVVFDVVLGYALFEHGRTGYFAIIICLVLSSLFVSQIVSLRWYWREIKRIDNNRMNQNHHHHHNQQQNQHHQQHHQHHQHHSHHHHHHHHHNNTTDSLDKKEIITTTTSSGNITTSTSAVQTITTGGIGIQQYQHQQQQLSSKNHHQDNKKLKIQRYTVITLHIIQLGVLWRYAKLFVPIDLRRVKHEVRDLCMLRLVHAFCEAAPMLLLQLYLLITIQSDTKFLIFNNNLLPSELKLKTLNNNNGITSADITGNTIISTAHQVQINSHHHHHHHQIITNSLIQQQTEKTFKDLNIVSAALSLFSVCWALASFSKNVRLQNVHRLVLTWLGVIFQFLWRLGTVTSRIASLTVYASFYNYWVFLVIILHWFSMFLWLISPKNVFHGEHISKLRKTLLSALIAFIYIFAYINLQEVNHRQKMITFYIVMFLENLMLVSLWLIGIWPTKSLQWYLIPLLIFGSFIAGIIFMMLYYRYFHVRRLGYEAGGRYSGYENENINEIKTIKSNINGNYGQPHIAGVFNCRFSNPVGNGATKRKKKKPTTFIPPPTLVYTSQISGSAENQNISKGPMEIAFWRRPLPSRSQAGGSSENEGSVGSRVNIHQKLQEKKQKQLAELKIIEEEIKQGKLGGPIMNTFNLNDDGRTSLPHQPIPRTKKHINLNPLLEWSSSMITTSTTTAATTDNNNPLLLQKKFIQNKIDEMNNLNKFSSPSSSSQQQQQQQQYDHQIYSSSFVGFTGINITASALETTLNNTTQQNLLILPTSAAGATSHQQQSSQLSNNNNNSNNNNESNSLTRQILSPRSKILHTASRNTFTDNYRNLLNNNQTINNLNSSNNDHHSNSGSNNNSATRNTASTGGGIFDHLNHQNIFLEINHHRQISGTYSSSLENGNNHGGGTSGGVGGVNLENKLQIPYNLMPPPLSKIDSQSTPPTPSIIMQQQQQQLTNQNTGKFTQRHLQRAKTPEVLLAPHYLDNSRVYYDWIGRETNYRVQEGERNNVISSGDENVEISAADDSIIGITERSANRNPSDIDSQVSLPRSYTLPREFRYYRRARSRKFTRNEQFIMSTNSSDGDVDSGDDNESERHSDTSQCHLRQQHQQQQQNSRILQKTNYYSNKNNSNNSSINNTHHQLRYNRNNFISSPRNETQYQQHDNNNMNNSNNTVDCSGGGIDSNMSNNIKNHSTNTIVNNLDLIRGASGNFNNFPNRPSKYRLLAPWKQHETKL